MDDDPLERTPQFILTGLFPKSLGRAADCLVYHDRFVFLGLSRRAIFTRAMAGGPMVVNNPAALPLALLIKAAGTLAAEKDARSQRSKLSELSPELAEAAEHSRSIMFLEIERVTFPKYVFGRPYAVDLHLIARGRERLLPATGLIFTKKDLVKDVLRTVLGDKVA